MTKCFSRLALLSCITLFPFMATADIVNEDGRITITGENGTTTGGYTGTSFMVNPDASFKFEDSDAAVLRSLVMSDSGDGLGGWVNISGNLLNNGQLPADPAIGDFAFSDKEYNETYANDPDTANVGKASSITAKSLAVGGNIINGNDNVAGNNWNLILNVDTITASSLTAYAGGQVIINPTYPGDGTHLIGLSTTGSINIMDGLYMGAAASGESLQINASENTNIYVIRNNSSDPANDIIDVTGDINVETGKLVIDTNTDVHVTGDMIGNMDVTGASLDLGGDLLADGTFDFTGDINIGGNVDGDLIISGADMYVAEDIKGYLSIDVDNLYIDGNLQGNGKIKAGNDIQVGGDLSGIIDVSAGQIGVAGQVLGGLIFRPNVIDPVTGFHYNPDVANKSDPFKTLSMTVDSTYFFNDNSFLQLVLNDASYLGTVYDWQTANELITVGGFDASGVTITPDLSNMDSMPNIEILIDGLTQKLTKIKLIHSTGQSIILGDLDRAGVWFYNADHSARVFQEAGLGLSDDGMTMYATMAMLQSMEGMTKAAPRTSNVKHNDIALARAIDDLILARLKSYNGSTDMSDNYTSALRLMFPYIHNAQAALSDNVFYNMMLNGGTYDDVISIMVENSLALDATDSNVRAVNFVRNFDLGKVVDISRTLSLSSRMFRTSVSNELMDDFIWTRFYKPRVFWIDASFANTSGGNINSFTAGMDWKVGKKWIAGATVGYNAFDVNAIDGHSFDFGGYATYALAEWGRAYGSLNITLHSADFAQDAIYFGATHDSFDSTDANLEVGLLHRIFDTYITGRAYANFAFLGGFSIDKKNSSGDKYMHVERESQFLITPGYEISLGKDIYLTTLTLIRPSVRAGIEYDLISQDEDFAFRFTGVDTSQIWHGTVDNPWWFKYGIALDFAFGGGGSIGIAYDILNNDDFDVKTFSVNGKIRF